MLLVRASVALGSFRSFAISFSIIILFTRLPIEVVSLGVRQRPAPNALPTAAIPG